MPQRRDLPPGIYFGLWLFPLLTTWLGLSYILSGPDRLGSAVFDTAETWLPMPAWGCVFLTVAAIKAACLVRSRTWGLVAAMCAGAGLYASWAVFYLGSVLTSPTVSLSAPAWPSFVALLHFAALIFLTGWRPHR